MQSTIDQANTLFELEPRLDVYSLLILLGIFQGLFLTYFYLSGKNRQQLKNVFSGLFILTISLIITEIWLNYTGYMIKVIRINDFSEPFNFLIGPFFFLYIKSYSKPIFRKKDFLHFIPFAFYLVYFMFYFLQPWQEKYNSLVWAYYPDFEYLDYKRTLPLDPLGIRAHVTLITFFHMIAYNFFGAKNVINEFKHKGIGIFHRTVPSLNWIRIFCLNFTIVLVIFAIVKLAFGRDLGDNIMASFIALVIYSISFQIIKRSLHFNAEQQETPEKKKYVKSSLSSADKKNILIKIEELFIKEKYYLKNVASLPGLAKLLNESQHNVSQVINEELNQSFFELLASYRINEAKKLLADNEYNSITIEEIAEQVGYNSKSAFNKVFKKITGKTPSEYRKTA